MTEGKGFQGRRQERKQAEQLSKFIKNQDKIIVIPDIIQKKTIKLVIKKKRLHKK